MLILATLLVAAPAEPSTTVVAPLRAVGVPADTVIILTAELRTHVGRSKAYRLVTPEEMGAIDEELERQLSGGCDEASCVAELGGALGAKYLITGQVGKLGKLFTLQLKMIDIETVAAKRTASGHSREIEGLLLKLPQLAGELLGEAAVKPAAKPVSQPAPAAPMPALLGQAPRQLGATLFQLAYRPLEAVGLRASLQLGERLGLAGSAYLKSEDGGSSQLLEADVELTLAGSQRGGFHMGLLGIVRAWTWSGSNETQDAIDLGVGPVAGYRLPFGEGLVADVWLAVGLQYQTKNENGSPQPTTMDLNLISGGIGIGFSPF